MSNPYTNPTLTGYNSNPPPDDGSGGDDNEITWAKHKDKIGDPLKNFSQAIDSAVNTAFDAIAFNAVSNQATNFTVTVAERGAVINVTATATITLLAAGTATSGFFVCVRNSSTTDTATVDGNGSETIDGELTVAIPPGGSLFLVSTGSAWITAIDFRLGATNIEMSGATILWAKGADIASGTTIDLSAADGNYIDITGTTAITGLGTVQAGALFALQFDGALTLTHNDTTLILWGADITTAAGDVALFISEGSGNFRLINYKKDNGLQPHPWVGSEDAGELTIATGAVTPTGSNHSIDTEADASTDDLDTLTATDVPDGARVTISIEDDGRNVVVKHATGNILLPNNEDVTLDVTDDTIELMFSAALSNWIQISRSISSETNPIVGFESTGQTISNSATLAVAHGLGVEPAIVQLVIECTTADLNYSIGDRLVLSPNINAESTVGGPSTVIDSTNVTLIFSSQGIRIVNKTTFAIGTITNGSWDLHVKAFDVRT